MKQLVIVFFFLLQYVSGYGQGKITGIIVDSLTQKPIEYVNIALYQKSDGKFTAGVITDMSGEFVINDIAYNEYLLKYSFIGYEKTGFKEIRVDKNNPVIDLGFIELTESPHLLDEVEVTAGRSRFVAKIDRKVFHAGGDLISSSGSVSDLLQNIPSIQVDIDGNISLRGSGNVQILVNGKTSSMMSATSRATVLQQIPANTIDRIEIITNPSAQYKPDGTSGIINIILKKDRQKGFNGTIAANAGNQDRYNSTLSLNYNPGKINIFGSYGIRLDDRSRYTFDDRTKTDESTGEKSFISQNTVSFARPLSQIVRGGFDWNISEKDNLEASASYIYMGFLRKDNTVNVYKDSHETVTGNYTRARIDDEYEKVTEADIVYTHSFGDEHELSIDYTHSSGKEMEDNRFTNLYALPVKPETKDNTLIWQDNRENLLRANYHIPLGEEAKINAGFETELDRSNLSFSAENLTNGKWLTDTLKTSHFLFDENIYALHLTYESTFGRFGIVGGLRSEWARIKSKLVTSNEIIPNNYSNLFPTLHTAYHLNDANELQLNYSLRINRPEGDDLNPFAEYRDPANIHVGNPHLLPEKIHSAEFGYHLKRNNAGFIATAYYRHIFNKMTEITNFINDTVMVTTKENLSTSRSAGMEFIANTVFGKIATVNLNADVFYNVVDASELGFGKNKGAVSWNMSVNGNLMITKDLMIQLNGRYTGKKLTPQGYNNPYFVLNTGAKYDLFNKKAALLLTVSDLFDTYKRVTTIDTPALKERIEQKRLSQILYIGFVYHFGSPDKKNKEASLKYDEQF